MLDLQYIDVVLGKATKLERRVLSKLNLNVKDGEFVVIIGSNGAGKSTMLNVISGFLKPEAGKVIIDVEDITNTPQSHRANFISKVIQDPKVGTMENMTIFENMAFVFKRGQKRGFKPFSSSARRELFQEKLCMLKIWG